MSDKKINELINSDNVDKVIEGYFQIGENKRKNFILDLFKDNDDVRISHHYKFKGISVFQSKMIALKKISGLEPPNEITPNKDSVILSFYYKWALKEKLLNQP